MPRILRIGLRIAAGLLALLMILVIAGVLVIRSEWFRQKVQNRVVQEAARITGGQVEMDRFEFDWSTLTARVEGFVLHGTEPAGEAPLLDLESAELGLRIISLMERQIDLASAVIVRPRFHMIIAPDGSTNFPGPQRESDPDRLWTRDLLNLRIGRYEIRDGALDYDEQRIPLNVRGDNLRIDMRYVPDTPSYTGEFATDGLSLAGAGYGPIVTSVETAFTLDEQNLRVHPLRLNTGESSVELTGTLEDLRSPHGSFAVEGTISVREAAEELDLPISARSPASLASRISSIFSQGLATEGSATFRGDMNLSFVDEIDFSMNGRLEAQGLTYQYQQIRLQDVALTSDIQFSQQGLFLNRLRTRLLGAPVQAQVRFLGGRLLEVEGNVDQLDVRTAAGVLIDRELPWRGSMAGPFSLNMTLGRSDVMAAANLTITPPAAGPVPAPGRPDNAKRAPAAPQPTPQQSPADQPIQGTVELTYDQAAGTLALGSSSIETPSTRLEIAGTLGEELRVRMRTTNLDDLLPGIAIAMEQSGQADSAAVQLPIALVNGSATVDGVVTGSLSDPVFDGQATAANATIQGYSFDRFVGELHASRNQVLARNLILGAGPAEVTGSAAITARPGSGNGGFGDGEITAQLEVREIDLGQLAREAGVTEPVSGTTTGTVRLSGSVTRPQSVAEIDVRNLAMFGERLDRAHANIRYQPGVVQIQNGVANEGPSQITFGGSYRYRQPNWRTGDIEFEAITANLMASRFEHVAALMPQVESALNGSLRGIGRMQDGVFDLTQTNLDVSASAITIAGQPVGALTILAETRGTDLAMFAGGNLREALVEGNGEWRLEGNAPGTASVRFSRISTDTVHELMMLGEPPEEHEGDLPFEGFVEGGATIQVALEALGDFQAAVTLDAMQVNPRPNQALQLGVLPEDLILTNRSPVVFDVTPDEVRVRTAEFTGRDTEMQVSGIVPFSGDAPADLNLDGSINLIILQLLNPNLLAEGVATLDTSIRGNLRDPNVNGRLQLSGASLYLADLPNGVDNAAGSITFDRRRATIENLVAETGGGEVEFSGFLEFGEALAYRLQAEARQVRVRYPEDVSSTFDAELGLNGTSEVSTLSGTVSVSRATFSAQADLGQLLSRALQPTPAPTESEGYLSGMQFDVEVQSAPAFRLETSLTRDLDAEVDLRLRGSPGRPILLGNISVNRGQAQVFGNRYSVDRGEIRFLNPVRIEPTLDMDLSTQARGVTVNITVSGGLQRLNVNYSSDPPLQTSEIIALLAVGRDPTTTSSIAAPGAGTASTSGFGDAGGLLGQALSSQASSQLQRFFGASRVKIDPTLTGVDNLPQARLTWEQQVSRDITLTYITNLNRTTEQLVRIQWDLNQDWSAIAVRDPNGLFGVDFQFRKRFR